MTIFGCEVTVDINYQQGQKGVTYKVSILKIF